MNLMTIPVFLCDDNVTLLSYYKRIIENSIIINDYDMELIMSTTDPADILLYLKKKQITNSLFFLDIDLRYKTDGIEVAQTIRNKNEFAQIVFITSHQELALESIKHQVAPLDFIVKGDDDEKKQIELILKKNHQLTFNDQSSNVRRHLVFKLGSREIRVDINSVYFLETSTIPHKIVLYGKNMMYEFYGKMNEIEHEYPELIRVHKSFLINPIQINSVDFRNRIICFPEEYSCTFPLVKMKLVKSLI